MADRKRPPPRRERWFEVRRAIPARRTWILGVAVWVIFFALWQLAVATGTVSELLVPTPTKVLATLHERHPERRGSGHGRALGHGGSGRGPGRRRTFP